MSIQAPIRPEILYPDSDGQPMSDDTLQFQEIVRLKGNLDGIFRHRDDVFVAGDLLWYPKEGDPLTRIGPDVLVAFGRLKGYRGSYMQWKEHGIAPQVIFEVLSPNNRPAEMARKFEFYRSYGVEEYYLFDPENNSIEGWLREGEGLKPIPEMQGWISPRLGIRFDTSRPEVRFIGPDEKVFLTFEEVIGLEEESRQRADEAEKRADEAEQRAERLAARLRQLGIDPNS